MSRYHVWTDGSALCDQSRVDGSGRFPGGWAAIVEHGSDGFVVRGRDESTTNVRMELRAAIEGLAAVPVGNPVTLHVDCTVVTAVLDRWSSGNWDGVVRKPDAVWWDELARQFERATLLDVDLLTQSSHVHHRAHLIAQAEARAAAVRLPPNAVVLARDERKDRKRILRELDQRAAP